MFEYPSRKLRYLEEMGIEVYVRKAVADSEVPGDGAGGGAPQTSRGQELTGPWLRLQSEVEGCTRCTLHRGRTQTVFGCGDPAADWLLVGEAPGFEEDRQGEPFVGRAGQLLNKMLAAIGFERSQVYIANVVKCRPPDNRNPRPDETAACEEYLQRQIDFVKPKIILALGAVAANTMLGTSIAVGKLRNQVHRYRDTDIPVVVTYHPAYLLRSPQQKRAAWDDLKFACRTVGKEIA